MYGYDNYQDHRLQPRESWLDDQPSAESIAEDLITKYRAAAIAELEAMVKAGEADDYAEEHIREFALWIAEENGETVETMMRDYQAEYIAAWYAH